MTKQFTLTRAEVVAADTDTLRAEIAAVTGSDYSAASIMRSLERLGTDASIEHYEMTFIPGGRMRGTIESSSWRVRADRGQKADEEAEGQALA